MICMYFYRIIKAWIKMQRFVARSATYVSIHWPRDKLLHVLIVIVNRLIGVPSIGEL